MNGIIQNTFRGVIIFIALMIALGVGISVYPFKEYTFSEQPYPVVSREVKAGESLKIQAEYCKLSNASGAITQIWEGTSRKIIPLGTFQGKKGCLKTVLLVQVPSDLPAGTYTLHNHGEYDKWLVGKAKVDTYSEEFTIK